MRKQSLVVFYLWSVLAFFRQINSTFFGLSLNNHYRDYPGPCISCFLGAGIVVITNFQIKISILSTAFGLRPHLLNKMNKSILNECCFCVQMTYLMAAAYGVSVEDGVIVYFQCVNECEQ